MCGSMQSATISHHNKNTTTPPQKTQKRHHTTTPKTQPHHHTITKTQPTHHHKKTPPYHHHKKTPQKRLSVATLPLSGLKGRLTCMWNDVWNDVKTTSSCEEQTLLATCGSATTGTNMLHIQDSKQAGLFFLHFQICWAASWNVQSHHHGRTQTMSGLEDRLSCMWNDKTTSRRRDFSTWQQATPQH